ncbi:SURF1 family protein [Herbiconiux sp. CPCC 205716]|uniref:SURF1-like protein n=1 Tax=Herbiconiux gentiana TaxID=2970912 RepID=A0ABT2GF49_9MICO|nr:SURF1 family cytochrome oxidase biogenesis protein [Herbiconiux gentiana]MCS5714807.1 SURF1 family protein [Herbiconiux gentiana]
MSTTGTPVNTRTPARPTLGGVMRRPRWIATLLLALAVAAGFAALGQWQLDRAVTTGTSVNSASETVLPLEQVAAPQQPVVETQAAQRAEVTGVFVPSGFDYIADRVNDGDTGYWVIGQVQVADEADTYLAVALGWTASEDEARATASALAESESTTPEQILGRYFPTEGPVAPKPSAPTSLDGGPLSSTMSVAELINRWSQFDDDAEVYGGYLVLDSAPQPLTAIDSPEPDRSVQLNWLNIFYAAEWVVFAGFAVYLWYRLVRDAWERELEELDESLAPDGRG